MPSVGEILTIFTAVDKYTAPLRKMSKATDIFSARTQRAARKISKSAKNIAVSTAIGAATIAAPLGAAVNEAVKFEDKLADVAKTTGLKDNNLTKFGDDILKMSLKTRTSIDDLLEIGKIGGQFGIAKKDLLSFTDTANKFNVALGDDFSGGVEEAVSSVAKMKNIFKETRNLNISDSITKTGSAINELGAQGTATSQNMSDFILRIGALPDSLKPSITNAAALGALLEESGVDSQIAASGLSNLLLVAGREIGGFAKQMKLPLDEAKKLLANDPTTFAVNFSNSLKGIKPDKLATILKKLKIGSQESIKVIGALSSGTKRLGELQKVSNDAFKNGTSLTEEYNKKNETTAAKLARAKNNMQAFSIIIGTQLLPLLGSIIEKVSPILEGFINWAKENKKTVKTILIITASVAALLAVVGVVSAVVAGVASAVASYGAVAKAVTVIQLFLNTAFGAFLLPILLVAAAVALVVTYWQDFGAALTFVGGIIASFFSPVLAGLALVISLVQSFRRNWDMIGEAFSEGGFLKGLLAIGVTLIDAVLMPLQQILELASNIPGVGNLAGAGAAKILELRESLGVNTTTDESGEPINAQAVSEKARVQREESVQRGEGTLTIKNETENDAKFDGQIPSLDVFTTSTQGNF